MTGLRLIIKSRIPEERSKAMDSMLYIIVGSFIIGSALFMTGFLVQTRNDLEVSNSTLVEQKKAPDSEKITDNKGNFLVQALTAPVTILNNFLIGEGKWPGLMGVANFKSIDELIFNNGNIPQRDPFSDDEWTNLSYLYKIIAVVSEVFLLIMVWVTGIKFIHYSGEAGKRADLKEDILRWFFCIYIVATGPILIQVVFYVFNGLTNMIYTMAKPLITSNTKNILGMGFVQNINTGSVLTTALVKLYFNYIVLKINILFMSRKIVLIVMYVFTPIAAALWGINKRINAFSIWMGEIISNSSMQFFYAIVLFAMVAALR